MHVVVHIASELTQTSQVLCLWDVSSQLCVHRLAGVFPNTQEDTHTLLFLHEEQQLLLLSFNSLLLLLETVKEEKRTSSHEHPVTCVLYNSLFRQVRGGNGSLRLTESLFLLLAYLLPQTFHINTDIGRKYRRC